MTTPEPPKPSKSKTWVALVGSLLAVAVPLLTQVSGFLPPPWPALIGGVIALLTMFGVYKAPYKPPNTVLVPASPDGSYTNPWKPA